MPTLQTRQAHADGHSRNSLETVRKHSKTVEHKPDATPSVPNAARPSVVNVSPSHRLQSRPLLAVPGSQLYCALPFLRDIRFPTSSLRKPAHASGSGGGPLPVWRRAPTRARAAPFAWPGTKRSDHDLWSAFQRSMRRPPRRQRAQATPSGPSHLAAARASARDGGTSWARSSGPRAAGHAPCANV